MDQIANLISVTGGDFREKVLEPSASVPVLVDFWADWCRPCHMLAPTLEALAQSYGSQLLIAKVNTETEPDLAAGFGIRSLPTLLLFRHGKAVQQLTGLRPEGEIRRVLDLYVESQADRLLSKVRKQTAQGNYDEAKRLLEEAQAADPENPLIHLDSAELCLKSGDLDAAEEALQALPANLRMDGRSKRLQAELDFTKVRNEAPDEQALEREIAADPRNLDARHQLSAHRVLAGDYEGALEALLEIMRQDRSFRDDLGRRGILASFELMGEEHDLVGIYRRKMASLLH